MEVAEKRQCKSSVDVTPMSEDLRRDAKDGGVGGWRLKERVLWSSLKRL